MITYPLNNIDYTAEDAELYFSTRESGVYDGNDFEVTVSGIDNDVTVGIGTAWIHNTKFSGKVTALTEPKTLTLSLPNSVYDRIDAIVIQFDANKNATEIVVKEGIASSAPIAPTVVRTESLYELHIFHVQRNAGATVIGVDNLIDLRNNSDYCGIMFDPIFSIDTTLTKSGYAADAKATGEAIKRATNVLNLLDNSDFRNPVNQRGASSYTGNGYTVDRWTIWSTSSGEIKVNSGGVGITLTANGGKSTFSQWFEQGGLDDAKSYTLAYMTTEGLIIDNNPVKQQLGSEKKYVEISVESSSVTVLWAALYEGEFTAETLPPYVAKERADEVYACKQYLRKYRNWAILGTGCIDWEGNVWIVLSNYEPMRIIPTASNLTTGTIVTYNGVYISNINVTPHVVMYHNQMYLIIDKDSRFEGKAGACALFLGDDDFYLNAEL